MLPNDVRKAIRATQLIEPDLKPGESVTRTELLDKLINQIKIQYLSCFLDENKPNGMGHYRSRTRRYEPPPVIISSVKKIPVFIQ